MPPIGLNHDPPKCLEVLDFGEQAHPANGTVQDVVHETSKCSAGSPQHGSGAYQPPDSMSN